MESIDKLKPCPFCGGEAKRSEETFGTTFMSWVYCTSCGAQGAPRHMEDEAAEAWNRRVGHICRFVDDSDGEFPPKCSACGYEPSIYECSWLGDDGYEYEGSYCPNCGAKVVDDD